MATSISRFPIQRGIRFSRITLIPLRNLTIDRRCAFSSITPNFQLRFKPYLRIRKCMYSDVNKLPANDGPLKFEQMLATRKAQAKQSMLVQVKSRQAADDFISFCQHHATVKLVYHYVLAADKEFLLVEFDSPAELRSILKETKFCSGEALPVPSQFVSFTGEEKKDQSASVIEYRAPNNDRIHTMLLSSADISEQMQYLYRETKLHDLETRLRFLVCAQLEAATSGIFPHGSVYPFGSSVNGCGQACCDLDMILDLKPKPERLSKKDKKRSLQFQAKVINHNSRMQSQRSLEVIGDIVSVMLPGCVGVQRILQARVPIIKFGHSFTGLECDLSTLNLTGVYMSELIYLYGACDSRLHPLLFTIRKWARDHGITNSVPGRWITNFQLILMVIFFLQQRPQPILPTFQQLVRSADMYDERVTEGVSCTFLRDLSKFPKSTNSETLGELLLEFFEFYEAFDYKDRGLSIVHGTDVMKSDHSALYIENPLERSLNVSQNVLPNRIDAFKTALREALWSLENELRPEQAKTWGIVSLFKPHSENRVKGFQVASLFENNESSTTQQTVNVGKQSRKVEHTKPAAVQQTPYEYVKKEIVSNALRRVIQNQGWTSKVTTKTPVVAAVLPVAVAANPRKAPTVQNRLSARLISQSTSKTTRKQQSKRNDLWGGIF